MAQPFVSVIVPTYNDWHRLALCINELSLQSYGSDNFEVIVVNNNPSDVAPVDLKVPDNCTILTESKSGSYAARNTALKIAKGEILGFTDSDCIPDKDWIKNAVEIFETNKDVSRIGGRIKIFPKIEYKYNSAELYDSVFAFRQDYYVKVYGTCVTGNMFTKRDVFNSVGVFNDQLMSGGDFEWAKRAAAAGYKIVYAPNVIINHPARHSFEELAQKHKRIAGGHFKVEGWKKGPIRFHLALIKKMFPVKNDLKLIFTKKDLSMGEKISVFLTRYKLQYIHTYEFFKLRRGSAPERV